MTHWTYIVLCSALPGRDDDLNEWYSDRHLPDVLRIPGVLAAQRFRLGPAQRTDPPYAYDYLAIYEIDPARAADVMATLRCDTGTPALPVSDAVAPEYLQLMFEPLTPRRVRASAQG
ncbi:hypothetical protein ACFPN2_23125 [Steroidobacter flavus]|uniref:Ethyl tert-butyl ether degradation protein EthD n=1 Tax=Steroidobacter flavus TaxID=1842136 RepID=A0ABV8SZC3_9GAMM